MEWIFLIFTLIPFIPSDSCRVEVQPPVQHLPITGDNKIISYDTYVSCKQLNKELEAITQNEVLL